VGRRFAAAGNGSSGWIGSKTYSSSIIAAAGSFGSAGGVSFDNHFLNSSTGSGSLNPLSSTPPAGLLCDASDVTPADAGSAPSD
jgi:hypothetical protein